MTTDTKAVARWDLIAVGENTDAMLEVHDGDYVLFTDHERVVREWQAGAATTMFRMTDALDKQIEELRTALAASRTEVERLKKDAQRYRWLRDSAPEEWDVTRWLDNEHQEVHVQDYLDEAIDAAMEKGNV